MSDFYFSPNNKMQTSFWKAVRSLRDSKGL